MIGAASPGGYGSDPGVLMGINSTLTEIKDKLR
jgi:hypothetical protein